MARRNNLSTSEVIRQAIEAWVERQEPVGSPYQLVSDLLGVVHGANPKRSERAGRRFAKLIRERRHGS
jgi:hypothetical protein